MKNKSYPQVRKTINKNETKLITRTKPNEWINYYSPQMSEYEKIIAVKHSMGMPKTLVSVTKEGDENRLRQINPTDFVHVSKNKAAWTSITPDIRWSQRSFSDIILYDIRTNKKHQLTKKGKYFAPALSPEADKVIAVEYNENLECSLVAFNLNNKEIISQYHPGNGFIRTPSWSEDGQEVVFVHSMGQKKALLVLHMATEKIDTLISYTSENISNPVFYNHYILYNSPVSGIGNIYAINRKTKEKYQITSEKYGAYNPSVSSDRKKMLFQKYTVNGHQIASMDIDPAAWNTSYEMPKTTNPFPFTEGKPVFSFDSIQPANYPVSTFSTGLRNLKLYQWELLPYGLGFDGNLYAINYLQTLHCQAGVRYNQYAKSIFSYGALSYYGLFPVIDLEGGVGNLYLAYEDDDDEYDVLGKRLNTLIKKWE